MVWCWVKRFKFIHLVQNIIVPELNFRSKRDPKDYRGIAHLLEHMVVLGSAKYKDKNNFPDYMLRCSGITKACTFPNETTYLFNVPTKDLDETLDRYSNFFAYLACCLTMNDERRLDMVLVRHAKGSAVKTF